MALATTVSAAIRTKPRLSFWEIWNMSFGFLGIQIGFALQNANVSRIFETLGARVEDIPLLWIAAPVTGLLVQPIVGYLSDRTWNRLGRRRPYFLTGAILASLALVAMPNSPTLWMAAGMLWIMDASINISMEPFRAFVGDNLPSEQRTTGFAMQSFLIGTGAVLASILPWLLTNQFGVSNEAPQNTIPDSVRFSFYFGAVVFFLAVLWTVVRSREYAPAELAAFTEHQAREQVALARRTREEFAANGTRQIRLGWILAGLGALLSLWLAYAAVQQVLILSVGIVVVGLLLIVSGLLPRSGRYDNGFVTVLNDFQDMPHTMKQLAWVQFFSWFALFAMWIYTTPAVTRHLYGTTDTTSALYNGQEVESPQKLPLFEREPVRWNQPHAKEARAFYARVIELARTEPAFISGDFRPVQTSAPRDVIAYRRGDVVVLVNARPKPVRVAVTVIEVDSSRDLLSNSLQRGDPISLPSYGAAVLKGP